MARSEPEILTGLALKPVKFCLPFSVTSACDSTGQANASVLLAVLTPQECHKAQGLAQRLRQARKHFFVEATLFTKYSITTAAACNASYMKGTLSVTSARLAYYWQAYASASCINRACVNRALYSLEACRAPLWSQLCT